MQRLHGVGGVDDLSHLLRKGKERNDPLPVLTPKPANRRILLFPLLLELAQLPLGLVVGRRFVDRFQIAHHLLTILPCHVVEAGPDHMHDAQLYLGFGKHRFNRLREALQSVHARQVDIFDTAVAQLHQDAEPELCSFRGARP